MNVLSCCGRVWLGQASLPELRRPPRCKDSRSRGFQALPGVEDRVVHRVIAIESHAQDFARGSFERVIANVGIGPLDQDRFEVHRTRGRIDRGVVVYPFTFSPVSLLFVGVAEPSTSGFSTCTV